jgi:type I restriction-modification system DNA methylase subunit
MFMRAMAEVSKLISWPYSLSVRYSLPSSFKCRAQFNNNPPDSQHKLNISTVPDDKLGDAYEYLIKEFADDSGHTAAELS